jgi:hypothetical protein
MPDDHTPNLPAFMLAPLPTDPVRRMTRLAHDLAYGAINNLWSTEFILMRRGGGYLFEPSLSDTSAFYNYRAAIWKDELPHPALLQSLGYVYQQRTSATKGATEYYLLTPDAFALLQNPSTTQAVFISYRRSVSSTMAMMVWAYLQRLGLDPFIDIRGIEPGEEWWQVILRQIDDCDTFFVMLTHGTLESEIVQQEIQRATAKNKRIIPILHDGFTVADLEQSALATLTERNLRELRHNAPAEEILTFLESLRGLLGVRYRDRV